MRDQELDYVSVLSRMTYKPNFEFLAINRDDRWWIRITMWVENSRALFVPWEIKRGFRREWFGPQRPLIQVTGLYATPFFSPGEEMLFIKWFQRTLRLMEVHESDEWLKYNGEIVNDPHKEN